MSIARSSPPCWPRVQSRLLSQRYHRGIRLLHDWRGASVLIATFGLTLIEDLTVGIIAGCVLAAALALLDRARQWRRVEP